MCLSFPPSGKQMLLNNLLDSSSDTEGSDDDDDDGQGQGLFSRAAGAGAGAGASSPSAALPGGRRRARPPPYERSAAFKAVAESFAAKARVERGLWGPVAHLS